MNKNLNILVVDDDTQSALIIEKFLKKQGHNAISVNSAIEGGTVLKKDFFDLVITDLLMPEVNGLEFLLWVNENSPRTKVIIVTGLESKDSDIKEFAEQKGAVEYFNKPVDLLKLKNLIDKTLLGDKSVRTTNYLGLLDFIQMLIISREQKLIVVTDPKSEITGSIYLCNGNLIDAQFGGLKGEEAFYKMVTLKTGIFVDKPWAEHSIRIPFSQLIINLNQRLLNETMANFQPSVSFSDEAQAEEQVEAQAEEPVETKAEELVETKAEELVETKAEELVEAQAEELVETKAEEHVETKAEEHVETKAEEHVETKAEEHVETKAEELVETKAEELVETKAEELVETKAEELVETKAEELVETKAEELVETKAEELVETKAEELVEAQAEEQVEEELEENSEEKSITKLKHPKRIFEQIIALKEIRESKYPKLTIYESGVALGIIVGETNKEEVIQIMKKYSKVNNITNISSRLFFYDDISVNVLFDNNEIVEEVSFGSFYQGYTSKGVKIGDTIDKALKIYENPKICTLKGAIWNNFAIFCASDRIITSIKITATRLF